MAENPLLPHRKLQDLYALMVRCRNLDKKQERSRKKGRASNPGSKAASPSRGRSKSALVPGSPTAREAVLAATSMHLLPGDLLCAEPGDRTAEQLAPASKASAPGTDHDGSALPNDVFSSAVLSQARLPLCAALARGLQAAAAEGMVLAYINAGASAADWAATLEWAQSAQLPLLLACTDATGEIHSRPRPTASARPRLPAPDSTLSLSAMNDLAQRLRVPVMPVDGEDAVAVYRVMQECTLRARMGGGPAVIWALMTPLANPEDLPRAQQPVSRLKSYMTTRGIKLA